MPFQKLWLPLVISLEVILVTIYAGSIHFTGGKPFPAFDVDGLRTIPSMLQATQLFLLGALPLGDVGDLSKSAGAALSNVTGDRFSLLPVCRCR
jgi:hypothetical protein